MPKVGPILHPEAKELIELKFGKSAYPKRIKMGYFPASSSIIKNSFNGIPGFSVFEKYFLPGFPEMAWPMMESILLEKYSNYFVKEKLIDLSILVYGAGESQLIDLMRECKRRYPDTKIYSLPSLSKKGNRIELGVRSDKRNSLTAINFLKKGVKQCGFHFKNKK